MCPICGDFEKSFASQLDQMRTSGDITLVMHPVSILDRASAGTQYSTRAASAYALVATDAPASLLTFHQALFDNQPAENTAGLSNSQLADLAKQAGVPDNVVQEISGGKATTRYGGWIQSVTGMATADTNLVPQGAQGFGTPTITINGTLFTGNWSTDPTSLTTAITAAKNG
jgi:protein-disulfide isomerase